MAIRIDPEGEGSRALLSIANLASQHVLEIGCGDGRFTWRLAGEAGQVTAIDPSAEQIALAMEQLPKQLEGRVEFRHIAFEDFAVTSAPSAFDIVILSWSLC